MANWIDRIKADRDRGVNTALSQHAHAAVNARHPGCTREHCVICGEETGRAGRHEDSIYREGPDGEEVRPLCEGCDSEMEVTNG